MRLDQRFLLGIALAAFERRNCCIRLTLSLLGDLRNMWLLDCLCWHTFYIGHYHLYLCTSFVHYIVYMGKLNPSFTYPLFLLLCVLVGA
jgi:hypothetical protein